MLTNIYTTYFANLKKLPADIIPISIALKPPAGYKGLVYSKLFPSEDMLRAYKRNGDEMQYVRDYNAQVLSTLNPYTVLKELGAMTDGTKIALVCFEKPDDFCHRHLIARWLKNIDINVKEFE